MKQKELAVSALILLILNYIGYTNWQARNVFLSNDSCLFYLVMFSGWIWIISKYKVYEKSDHNLHFKLLWSTNVILLLVFILINSLQSNQSIIFQIKVIIFSIFCYVIWIVLSLKYFMYKTLLLTSVLCLIGIIPMQRIEMYNIVNNVAEPTEEFIFESKESYEQYKYFYTHENIESYVVLKQSDLIVTVVDLFSEIELQFSFSNESERDTFLAEHTMGDVMQVPVFRDGMIFDDKKMCVLFAPVANEDNYFQTRQRFRYLINGIWYVYTLFIVIIGTIYEKNKSFVS